MRMWVLVLAAVVVSAAPSHAQQEEGVVETFSSTRPKRNPGAEADKQLAREAEKLSIAIPKRASEILELPKLDYQKIREEDRRRGRDATRVGVHREVPDEFACKWFETRRSDGKVTFRAVIHSPGATFVRPHFTADPTPPTEVYVYGEEGAASLQGPVTRPAMYQGEGFWGPVVQGEYLYVEVVEEAGSPAPKVRIDQISHGYLDPISLQPAEGAVADSTKYSCHLDVNCYSWSGETKTGIARMVFEDQSDAYVCTGALVMDKAHSFRNWFLTANHCISDETTANSLIAYFNYRTSSCNGVVPSLSSLPRSTGATYVTGKDEDSGSDYTLLELAQDPPDGTTYLGWTTADIASGTYVAGIHHPNGTHQRVSFGSVRDSYLQVVFNHHWDVAWSEGLTEGGSSGSPILTYSGKQIIGQLSGHVEGVPGMGEGTCSSPYHSFYGKFGISWNDSLKTYLGSGTCSYNLNATSASYGFGAQEGSVSVTAALSSCAWSAASNASWITITGGSSATGSGTVSYSVAANASTSARTGTVTIAGQVFTVTQMGAGSFRDVPAGSVYAGYIAAIAKAGLTFGCGNGNYCPSANVTRGQMAAFIERSLRGENFTYSSAPYFRDVPFSNVFFKYVQRLKDDGVTAVTGVYDVDGYVTRGQMAAFLVRAKYGETFSYSPSPYFVDVPSGNIFYKYVQKLRDAGITALNGTYFVDSYVTREQMAAFLSRAFLGMQ